MFNRFGRLAISGAIGVIIGAGAILGITSLDSDMHVKRHMIVETAHLVQGTETNFRHHKIAYVANPVGHASAGYCRVYDEAPNGDTLTIIVPNAMPTYDLLTNPATIVECETRK